MSRRKRFRGHHRRALVLNADYTSIGVLRWQKIIKQDVGGIVRVIDYYPDDKIRCSGGIDIPCPAVVVQNHYKDISSEKVPFSRKNVFIRDRLRCQYCGIKKVWQDLTFDHVIPRSKFKGKYPTTWENIVTCCHPCNRKKGDFTLEQSGMKLIRHPFCPSPYGFVRGLGPWDLLQPEWVKYVPKYYLELLKTEVRNDPSA